MSTRVFPRVLRQLSATALGATVVGTALYQYSTQGQKLYPFDQAEDPLAQSAFSKAINPYQNDSLSDIHVARIPISELPSNLLRDHENGGSRLIETYCAGLLGGWAFSIQRQIASMKGQSSPNMLLSKAQILDSDFKEGTSISNEFVVVDKSSSSIVLRGGSPSDTDGLRKVDVLVEASVEVDREQKEAVFGLKCMFYSGLPKGAPPPLPKALEPLHLIYAKAMAANGVARCREWTSER